MRLFCATPTTRRRGVVASQLPPLFLEMGWALRGSADYSSCERLDPCPFRDEFLRRDTKHSLTLMADLGQRYRMGRASLSTRQQPIVSATTAWLPAVYRKTEQGGTECVAPAEVCPELLTEDEAIRYLRLDLLDMKDRAGTLEYYRAKGLLRGTQVGKVIRYRRVELDNFLAKQTEINPR